MMREANRVLSFTRYIKERSRSCHWLKRVSEDEGEPPYYRLGRRPRDIWTRTTMEVHHLFFEVPQFGSSRPPPKTDSEIILLVCTG